MSQIQLLKVNEALAPATTETANGSVPKKYFTTGAPSSAGQVKAAPDSNPGAHMEEMAAASSKGKNKETKRSDLGINSSKKKASATSGPDPFDKPITTTLGLDNGTNTSEFRCERSRHSSDNALRSAWELERCRHSSSNVHTR
ncbi:uncharacterized protein G2W53_022710 [Senna tora]|uniref:Uncharacterized protein n=1 Tax=Senna tora TaxID=362788 RepID=A0A834TPF9_9FABA|nr:uncharacterized protein G2W53_022710 [Senna tora]